jgi:hypothetical protein
VAAVDAYGYTALHRAAFAGHAAVVQLLLDAHAAVNAPAANGYTPLHEAAFGGHTAVVQLLNFSTLLIVQLLNFSFFEAPVQIAWPLLAPFVEHIWCHTLKACIVPL